MTTAATLPNARQHGAGAALVGARRIDIVRIAAAVVALGLLASALLVRRTDVHREKDGTRPVVAAWCSCTLAVPARTCALAM